VLNILILFPSGKLSNIKKRFEFFLFQPLSKTSEIIYFANAFLVFFILFFLSRSAATTFFLFSNNPTQNTGNYLIQPLPFNFGVISTIPTNLLSHEAIGFPVVFFNFNPIRKPKPFSFPSKALHILLFSSRSAATTSFSFHRYLLVRCPTFQNVLFLNSEQLSVMKFCQNILASARFRLKSSFCILV